MHLDQPIVGSCDNDAVDFEILLPFQPPPAFLAFISETSKKNYEFFFLTHYYIMYVPLNFPSIDLAIGARRLVGYSKENSALQIVGLRKTRGFPHGIILRQNPLGDISGSCKPRLQKKQNINKQK